jgi:hypothetical protein
MKFASKFLHFHSASKDPWIFAGLGLTSFLLNQYESYATSLSPHHQQQDKQDQRLPSLWTLLAMKWDSRNTASE